MSLFTCHVDIIPNDETKNHNDPARSFSTVIGQWHPHLCVPSAMYFVGMDFIWFCFLFLFKKKEKRFYLYIFFNQASVPFPPFHERFYNCVTMTYKVVMSCSRVVLEQYVSVYLFWPLTSIFQRLDRDQGWILYFNPNPNEISVIWNHPSVTRWVIFAPAVNTKQNKKNKKQKKWM